MRSRETRRLAERALAELVRAVGHHAGELVVIGGLNADLLTDPGEAPHQGTLDVDRLVQLAVVYDRDDQDIGWLERGLEAAGFRSRASGWRWWRDVEGVPVKVELLCDVYDSPGQEIPLPGCVVASAQNLHGPGAALAGSVSRAFTVEGTDGSVAVTARFASLGGYLLAKAAAAHDRALGKDYYDFAFHLLYNTDGGPAAAGRAARRAIPVDASTDHARVLLAVLDRFADVAGPAARAYADLRSRDGVSVPLDVLARDAVAAARVCRDAFLASFQTEETPS